MRVAALYDIHGNLPALEAVLAEVRETGADRIVIGGDVLLGPMPRETLGRLLALDVPTEFIRGNCDREVLAALEGAEKASVPEQVRESMRWVARQLRPDDVNTIAEWPQSITLHVDGLGEVLFCHATPRNDTEIFTRDTDAQAVRAAFHGVSAPVVVCGHTHMQFDRVVDVTRIVNAGSVGMPFGTPRAQWLLAGPDIELRQTAYDLDEAAARILATPYPQAQDFVSRNVLRQPSEVEMLKIFAGVELQ